MFFSQDLYVFLALKMFQLENCVFPWEKRVFNYRKGFLNYRMGVTRKKVLFSELWQIHSTRLTLLTGRYWFKMGMVWQERLYEMWKMES